MMRNIVSSKANQLVRMLRDKARDLSFSDMYRLATARVLLESILEESNNETINELLYEAHGYVINLLDNIALHDEAYEVVTTLWLLYVGRTSIEEKPWVRVG